MRRTLFSTTIKEADGKHKHRFKFTGEAFSIRTTTPQGFGPTSTLYANIKYQDRETKAHVYSVREVLTGAANSAVRGFDWLVAIKPSNKGSWNWFGINGSRPQAFPTNRGGVKYYNGSGTWQMLLKSDQDRDPLRRALTDADFEDPRDETDATPSSNIFELSDQITRELKAFEPTMDRRWHETKQEKYKLLPFDVVYEDESGMRVSVGTSGMMDVRGPNGERFPLVQYGSVRSMAATPSALRMYSPSAEKFRSKAARIENYFQTASLLDRIRNDIGVDHGPTFVTDDQGRLGLALDPAVFSNREDIAAKINPSDSSSREGKWGAMVNYEFLRELDRIEHGTQFRPGADPSEDEFSDDMEDIFDQAIEDAKSFGGIPAIRLDGTHDSRTMQAFNEFMLGNAEVMLERVRREKSPDQTNVNLMQMLVQTFEAGRNAAATNVVKLDKMRAFNIADATRLDGVDKKTFLQLHDIAMAANPDRAIPVMDRNMDRDVIEWMNNQFDQNFRVFTRYEKGRRAQHILVARGGKNEGRIVAALTDGSAAEYVPSIQVDNAANSGKSFITENVSFSWGQYLMARKLERQQKDQLTPQSELILAGFPLPASRMAVALDVGIGNRYDLEGAAELARQASEFNRTRGESGSSMAMEFFPATFRTARDEAVPDSPIVSGERATLDELTLLDQSIRAEYESLASSVKTTMKTAHHIVDFGKALSEAFPRGIVVEQVDPRNGGTVAAIYKFDPSGVLFQVTNTADATTAKPTKDTIVPPQIFASDSLYMKVLKGIHNFTDTGTYQENGIKIYEFIGTPGEAGQDLDPDNPVRLTGFTMSGKKIEFEASDGSKREFKEWLQKLNGQIDHLMQSQVRRELPVLVAWPWLNYAREGQNTDLFDRAFDAVKATVEGGGELRDALKIWDSDPGYKQLREELHDKTKQNFTLFFKYLLARARAEAKSGSVVPGSIASYTGVRTWEDQAQALKNEIREQLKVVSSLHHLWHQDVMGNLDKNGYNPDAAAEAMRDFPTNKSWTEMMAESANRKIMDDVVHPTMTSINNTVRNTRHFIEAGMQLGTEEGRNEVSVKLVDAGIGAAMSALVHGFRIMMNNIIENVFDDRKIREVDQYYDSDGKLKTSKRTVDVSFDPVRRLARWVLDLTGFKPLQAYTKREMKEIDKITRTGIITTSYAQARANLGMQNTLGFDYIPMQRTYLDSITRIGDITYDIPFNQNGRPKQEFVMDVPITDMAAARFGQIQYDGARMGAEVIEKTGVYNAPLAQWWHQNQQNIIPSYFTPIIIDGHMRTNTPIRAPSPRAVSFKLDDNGVPHIRMKFDLKDLLKGHPELLPKVMKSAFPGLLDKKYTESLGKQARRGLMRNRRSAEEGDAMESMQGFVNELKFKESVIANLLRLSKK